MVKVRILGISGTVVKDGNCDKLLQEALKAAAEVGDVETEFITLADKEIAMCKHCQWCIENYAPCKIMDDAHMVFDRMREADGIIFAAPTWDNTLSPPLINLFSRRRYFSFFTHDLRNKVAGAVTLGWFRNYGMDQALDTIENLVKNSMIAVARGSAISSTAAFGQRAAFMEHGVVDDVYGVKMVRNVGYRVVEVARMIKYAAEAGIGVPDKYSLSPVGARIRQVEEKVFVEGVWRERTENDGGMECKA